MIQDKEIDLQYIREARAASNTAIASHDAEGVAKYWMKDIVVISGEGGQYSGRNVLLKTFRKMFSSSPSVFQRLPAEIIIAESGILAWEPAAGIISMKICEEITPPCGERLTENGLLNRSFLYH